MRVGAPKEAEADTAPKAVVKPSAHARAARDGRGGARGGKSGRINEREDADPEPQPVQMLNEYGRGGVRAQRGRGGKQMQSDAQAPMVAMGGQLGAGPGARGRRGGRDTEYDRGEPAAGRGGYQGAERGGMRGGRGASVAGRGGPHVAMRADDRGAAPPQRGRGRGGSMMGGGGILGGGMDVGMEVPHMVHRPHMGNMRIMADDYDDDPNDPFPALTKSHAGGRMSANDQTVTVNIRGLGGRGPVQRAALDGGDDGFANIGMPAANANRPGGRRARGPNEPNFMAGTSITPSLAMAPHFTPTSINSMGAMNMPNNMQMPHQPNHQQLQQQQQVQARAVVFAMLRSIACRPECCMRPACAPAPPLSTQVLTQVVMSSGLRVRTRMRQYACVAVSRDVLPECLTSRLPVCPLSCEVSRCSRCR